MKQYSAPPAGSSSTSGRERGLSHLYLHDLLLIAYSGREVPLFVPFYGFLLVCLCPLLTPVFANQPLPTAAALPASILNIYFFLKQQTPTHTACAKAAAAAAAAATEAQPPPDLEREGEWEPSSPRVMLKGEQKWGIGYMAGENVREREWSVSKASTGPSEEQGWAMVGRPSEWARTASGIGGKGATQK